VRSAKPVVAKPLSPAVLYDSANYGWIGGNYPEALRHAEALLNAPGNEASSTRSPS